MTSLTQQLPFLANKYIRVAFLALCIVVLAAVSGLSYAYASSPGAIRDPRFEHLHFRMLLTVDGKQVNFADDVYQQGYAADNCNADLTVSPVHFHDKKDQFVHIHWKNLTGGMVLKYYGLNRIGGVDGMLGTRFDAFPNLMTVPIHGKDLPVPKGDDKYYAYVGDATGYQTKSFDDFTHKTIESFFGKNSNVGQDEAVSVLDKLFPKASAHAGHDHSTAVGETRDLAEINNLVGNVVIFVQRDKPTDQQIKERFANLEPLSESACAG